MKKRQLFFLATILLMVCFGCSNDEDSPDLASGVTGFYNGNWVVSGYTRSGTCDVTRVSDTSVKLSLEILGIEISDVPDVKLSDGGNGKINFSFSDSEGSISGNFQGKVLTLSITDGSTTVSFSGTMN